MKKIPIALTIAGSDCSGGAGIQADIKVFSEFCVYSMSVITSITAQNTMSISRIKNMDEKIFAHQLNQCLKDIKPDSFKTGMIPCDFMAPIINRAIEKYDLKNFVLDPVMISKTGNILSNKNAIYNVKKYLLPLSYLITPNIPEAEFLSGIEIKNEKDMIRACENLEKIGAKAILLKGGHLKSLYVADLLYIKGNVRFFKNKRIKTKNTHGTGCSLSSAIVSMLAKGMDLESSVDIAVKYINGAIKNSLDIGKGKGPLNHFWRRT